MGLLFKIPSAKPAFKKPFSISLNSVLSSVDFRTKFTYNEWQRLCMVSLAENQLDFEYSELILIANLL